MSPASIGTRRDHLGRIQLKPPAKTAKRRSTTRSGFGKVLVAPVERRAQRLVPWQCRAPAVRQESEAIAQARRCPPHRPVKGAEMDCGLSHAVQQLKAIRASRSIALNVDAGMLFLAVRALDREAAASS